MNKIFTGILCLLLAAGFTGCGLLKHHKGNKPATDTTASKTVVVPPVDTSAKKIVADSSLLNKPKIDTIVISPEKRLLIDSISPLWEQPYDFNTFDGKAKMSYGNKNFAANLRVRKDSLIWIAVSGSAFGITLQVARIMITPDTFKMVNYLEKEVTIMPLSEAAKLLPTPMDFSSLQNFIVGQPLKKTGKITDAADSSGIWMIQLMDSVYQQHISYNKTDSTMLQSNMNTINPKGPKAVIHYGNYDIVDGRKFSKSRVMDIDNAGRHYKIEMNFVNQQFDKPLDIPFSIPSNYSVNR